MMQKWMDDMRQESADDFIQMAKDLAKAERELGVQKWVSISIERVDKNRNREQIFTYDLPREVYERWEWVVNWRRAKLVCKYPKDHVNCYFSFYDKRLGNNPKFISGLKTLASAKAQVTKVQRKIDEYIAYNKANNLFFDENTDDDYAGDNDQRVVRRLLTGGPDDLTAFALQFAEPLADTSKETGLFRFGFFSH